MKKGHAPVLGDASERDRSEDGMVTVEIAIGFAALVFVLTVALMALGAAQSRAVLCEEVRVAARSHSLGGGVGGAAEGMPGSTMAVIQGSGSFKVVGTKPAASLAGWNLGTLRCEIAGIPESGLSWLSSGRAS